MGPPFFSREPIRSTERSSIGSGPGPVNKGEDTPKLAVDQELDSQANSHVLNRVAWAGGWQSKPRGSKAPQRRKSRLLPSQTSVYSHSSAFATCSGRFTGESPVQVQYTSVVGWRVSRHAARLPGNGRHVPQCCVLCKER